MVGHLEPTRCESGYLGGAGMNVIHAITTSAQEMVVVVSSGLETRGLPRQMHRCHRALFNKKIQISVHRCQVQIGNLLLRHRQQFLWQQGAAGLLDRLPDRTALSSDTSHAAMVAGR